MRPEVAGETASKHIQAGGEDKDRISRVVSYDHHSRKTYDWVTGLVDDAKLVEPAFGEPGIVDTPPWVETPKSG